MDASLKYIKERCLKDKNEVERQLKEAIDDLHKFWTKPWRVKREGWPKFLLRNRQEVESLHKEDDICHGTE